MANHTELSLLAKEIKRGHGLTDISCSHGSRFIWWYDKDSTGPLGDWMIVVQCSWCHCGKPPLPFKSKAHMDAFLSTKEGSQTTLLAKCESSLREKQGKTTT